MAFFDSLFVMKENVYVFSQRRNIIRITLTSLFAALIAAGTFISIPIPGTPITIILQNMFALMSGLILGPFLGFAAAALFLIIGILGAPIFPRANGGIAYLLGPSGGFLMGFPLMALCAGLIAGQAKPTRIPLWRIMLASILGMLVVYIPGVMWLKYSFDDTWQEAIVKGFLPFIAVDIVKAIFAGIISRQLRQIVAEHLNA